MTLNLPNILTLLRIILIPVIIVFLLMPHTWTPLVALALYVFACVTDWFDGYYARKNNITSAFGRFLDPIADKLLIGVLLIVFAALGHLYGWGLLAACAIMFREILISGLREYLGPHRVVIHVSNLAKWKTTVQMIALGFLILPMTIFIGQVLLSVAAILTIITGYDYMKQGLSAIKTLEEKND